MKIKQLETLLKEVEKMQLQEIREFITLESAREYYTEDSVLEKEVTDNKKLAILVYRELKKAISKKDITVELDCNYEKSKMHLSEKYLFDYCSVLNSSRDRAVQIYITANVKKKEVYFRLCTSCKKVTREQFEMLEKQLLFTVKRDKKTNRAKTTERKKVSYDDIVNVVNTVLALLNNKLDVDKILEQSAVESTDSAVEENAVEENTDSAQ